MSHVHVIAAALLVAGSCDAYGECASHAFYSTQREDGTRIGLTATDAELARDPAWTPGHGEPPISTGRAYDLALAWARANWKRYDSFGLESIDLQSVGCYSTGDKWLYVVHLAPVIDGNRLFGGAYVLAVLMDGSIIAPTTMKKDF
jgi:hypothetical protein